MERTYGRQLRRLMTVVVVLGASSSPNLALDTSKVILHKHGIDPDKKATLEFIGPENAFQHPCLNWSMAY